MAKKILKLEKKIHSENSFLDVNIPDLSWIKINLTHFQTNYFYEPAKIEKTVDDFQIQINLSEKLGNEDKELSKKIQEICKLTFPPYYWKEKSYKFYTSEKTGSTEEKKAILINILDCLSKYKTEKVDDFENSNKLHEEDKKKNILLESNDLIMKFHEKTERFVVLAKDFLGPERYNLLRSCSEYSSQLISPKFAPSNNQNQYLLTTDFFNENLPNKKIEKKTYFFINPSFYEKIKNHFKKEEEEKIAFIENQKNISNKKNLSDLNVEYENIFGLKIKFNEENQCFSFYAKGYFDQSSFMGMRNNRNLLALWALNFIYTEDSDNSTEHEVLLEGKDKIFLSEIKGGSKRDKDVHIPASDWEKIKKIKENFEHEMKFWSRGNKDIKITHCDFSGLEIFDRFPAIYIDNKGNCFFAYSSRRMGVFKSISSMVSANSMFDMDDFSFAPVIEEQIGEHKKKKKEPKFSQTIKTIPISFAEAKHFLNEHPFADKIKKGSILLNSTIHAGAKNPNILNVEERDEIFSTMLLMAEMNSVMNKDAKTKNKKIKI